MIPDIENRETNPTSNAEPASDANRSTGGDADGAA